MSHTQLNTADDTSTTHTSTTTYGKVPYKHYQLTSTSPSLALDIPGQPYVDRQQMSARAVISTATLDRVGDVLLPSGCRLENYRKNPVVLWAHGLEGTGVPIGTSRSPNGDVAVSISKSDVQATCWFSQSSLEAAQIFELIDEGIIRATSVRETPLKSHVRHDPQLGDVLVVEEWELEEWSWCAVGVNPDAVAKNAPSQPVERRPDHALYCQVTDGGGATLSTLWRRNTAGENLERLECIRLCRQQR